MKTTLLRKNLMALTGLFLVVFLMVHLAGNFQLLLPPEEAAAQFNAYSKFMTGNPLIKTISYLLYASILGHVVLSVIITVRNRRAATAGGTYAYDRRQPASPWYARNMGLLGSVVLLFLIVHMRDFWYVYKFGDLPTDAAGRKDLFTIVVNAFGQPWYLAFYVVSFVALGYHLLHGFVSAFKTLGAYPARLYRFAYYAGLALTLALTAGFIVIPVLIYLNYHA